MPASMKLAWTAANTTNEDGYGIERKTGATGTYAEIARVAANVLTFTDTNLPFGVTYVYRVYAYNASTVNGGFGPGRSDYCTEVLGTTISNPLPAPPSGLTVTPL